MLAPYLNKNHCADNHELLRQMPADSVDLVCADPQYGYSFMNKHWDKALPSVEMLAECLRVLKPGAFGFFMASPRQDVLSQMMMNLKHAGFNISFSSIYWTYATGFPKAANISKAIDKKLGVEREVVGVKNLHGYKTKVQHEAYGNLRADFDKVNELTAPASEEAHSFEGAYGGFQPKPAVEVIIVAMKPMNKKTFVDQALHNGKGVTWLGDCRIPYGEQDTAFEDGVSRAEQPRNDIRGGKFHVGDHDSLIIPSGMSQDGRFPANMLVSDDVLNDGKEHPTSAMQGSFGTSGFGNSELCYGGNAKGAALEYDVPADSGSYSRYFDLDAWFDQCTKHIGEEQWNTFPFLIVPKPASSEKDMGLQHIEPKVKTSARNETGNPLVDRIHGKKKRKNHHPTVKPITLMSYLIALGSREGDVVLDPVGRLRDYLHRRQNALPSIYRH